MVFKFYCSGLKEADGSEKFQEEYEKKFDDFCGQILNFDNLVILAGSGTSLSFNPEDSASWIAPSMWHLWDVCSKINNFEDVKNISQYEDQAPKSADGQTKKDIELLLSLIDQQLVFGSSSDKELLQTFKDAAIKEIISATDFVSKKSNDLTEHWGSHRQFVNKLGIRKAKQARLKIFTTNYDMAFEQAASDEGFIIIDGFDFSKPYRFNPMWYQYDVVRRSEQQGSGYLDNVLHLYKLHGSVDWCLIENEVRKHNGEKSEGEPVIIYPSSNKYRSSYDSPYLDMVSSFTNALKQPNTALICVGFGFNDDHLNNAINMALRTNVSLHLLVATRSLLSSDNQSIKTFKKLIDDNQSKRVGLFDGDFRSFVDAIPAHGNKTPDIESAQAELKILLKGANNG